MKSVKTLYQERFLDSKIAEIHALADELETMLAHGRMVIDGLNRMDPMLSDYKWSRPEARPYPYE